jgi:hypothetical protein
MISTPGITAPEASVTIPVNVAVVWPKLVRGEHKMTIDKSNKGCLCRIFIGFPLSFE